MDDICSLMVLDIINALWYQSFTRPPIAIMMQNNLVYFLALRYIYIFQNFIYFLLKASLSLNPESIIDSIEVVTKIPIAMS